MLKLEDQKYNNKRYTKYEVNSNQISSAQAFNFEDYENAIIKRQKLRTEGNKSVTNQTQD